MTALWGVIVLDRINKTKSPAGAFAPAGDLPFKAASAFTPAGYLPI
jgi:hypothetical protein